ncbi:hypothetical protein [Actinoplanes couchii]|uniref:Uncharacterized protein n=1 Tax=Actinoplanes couchii TaxID=403638 RepID=A0ABQ3X6Q3_9ACTN|nr:hypothetical protein [Actinoplanes couchii]MDR6322023.1 hypothetical protein [Actinoplanes couchii]GID54187.1 hypothetical protein Aco03nite_025910 [Actinoplanes couchii]
MAQDPDTYAIWGDWDLQQFKVQVARWRSTTPPPPDEVVTVVDHWWRRLKQPLEWTGAQRVSSENDPGRNLRWMWVPDAHWLDESVGYFRTQCYFRTFENVRPPRLVCAEFRTVQAMPPFLRTP